MIILVLVIGMILTFVAGHQIAEKKMLAPGRPGAGEFSLPPVVESVYHNCAVSTERVFEERMVEAELMGLDEMTMCENVTCENCKPSRDHIRHLRRVKQQEEAAKMKEAMDKLSFEEQFVQKLNEHNNAILVSASVPHENMAPRRAPADVDREKAFKQLRAKQSKQARGLTREVAGRLVPVPNNVPKRAEVFMQGAHHGELFIVWTWTVDGTPNGKPMAIKQHIDPDVFKALPLAQPKVVAKSYAKGAIKDIVDLDMLLCPPCEAPIIDTERTYR